MSFSCSFSFLNFKKRPETYSKKYVSQSTHSVQGSENVGHMMIILLDDIRLYPVQ